MILKEFDYRLIRRGFHIFIKAVKIKTLELFRFKDFIRVKADNNILGKFELVSIKFFILHDRIFYNIDILIKCFFIDFHEFGLFLSVEIIINYRREFFDSGINRRVIIIFF